MVFNLVFVRILFCCFFLPFCITDLSFLMIAAIVKTLNPTVTPTIAIAIPINKAKQKIETHLVSAYIKINNL